MSFFYLVKAKPLQSQKSCQSRNAITNFRLFPYLDFELSLPQVRIHVTDDFAILSNRLFKIKTAVKIVIKYKFISRN